MEAQLLSQMIKHNQLYKIQVMMILEYKIKLVHLVHLLNQLKNPLFLKEFIMFLKRITYFVNTSKGDISDISKGVQTRSRIASFCEHYSFISFL